jgi:glutamyl-tRNA synthetase
MTVTVRFAPSPTGFLHIGNARPALWNWLYAKAREGTFILRLDDTDRERSEERFADAIIEDLHWLGVVPDVMHRQSDRLERYALAFERLKASGALYPAYETADELEKKRRRQQARGVAPVYDRAALQLTESDRQAFAAEGRRPHWRFKLSGETARWQDGVRGESHVETSALSDPVLVREDGTVLYTFASVVDDIEMNVTDVIRGEDHVANTAVQIELFRALGGAVPRFVHLNLIVSATGEEMSKRKGSLSIRSFREEGAEALAVAAVAVLSGTSHSIRPIQSLDELLPFADPGSVSRALTKFDPAEIRQLSAKILHEMPFEQVRPRLAALGIPDDEATVLWPAVRGNLERLEDINLWHRATFGPMAGVIEPEDVDFVAAALDVVPAEPWDYGTWTIWTEQVKAITGRKGKSLFMPLRRALTGQDHGPDLKALMPLMGRERVLGRLGGGVA